jgi:TonB family protein
MIFVLAAAAVAQSLYAPSPDPPDWVRRPTGADVANAYPERAHRQGVSGDAVIGCKVGADGGVHDCKVLVEQPTGWAFGNAALRLAPFFRLRPGSWTPSPDQPDLRIPVRFRIFDNIPRSRLWIENPAWTSAPTFADLARAYPAKAAGSVGQVILQCPFAADGTVKDTCDTQGETPRGMGFGKSARGLASSFKIDPTADALRQQKTLWVTLTFRLAPPDSDDMRNHHILDPRWMALPTPAQITRLFPTQAAARGLTTGRGVARCRVVADGSMTDCTALPGEPDGLGFSEAAVIIASTMRMSRWSGGGGPVDGATVDLPIRIDLAPPTPKLEKRD